MLLLTNTIDIVTSGVAAIAVMAMAGLVFDVATMRRRKARRHSAPAPEQQSTSAAQARLRPEATESPSAHGVASDNGHGDLAASEHFSRVYRPPRPLPDYYRLLGVAPHASSPEIETAYRRWLLRMHPDLYFDDPQRYAQGVEQLKELNGGMRILRDPLQRAHYDVRRIRIETGPLGARLNHYRRPFRSTGTSSARRRAS